jgi:N-acetylmuramoyl-L-alanine amidase
MLETLLSHPLTLRLGWTLVHSLWQGAVLAALLGLALFLLGPHPNRLRHAFACLALLLWLATPVTTFLVLKLPLPAMGNLGIVGTTPPASTTPEPSSAEPGQVTTTRLDGQRSTLSLPELRGLLPYAALTWLVTASLLSLRLLGGIILAQRLARTGTPLVELQARLDALASRLGIRRRVRLLASTLVDAPTALGWLRPVILLPASAVTGLTPAQLELILAHELAHIRRLDYLVNILQGVTEAVLFYHPLTWWLSPLLRSEREHACDDLALSATGSAPLALAEALARLETSRPAPAPALAATGNLSRRVRRLLRRPQPAPARTSTLLPALGTVLLGFWLAVSIAQQPAPQGNNWSVVIDPAHSDLFPGVGGPVEEADLTLTVARRARELLEEQGVEVRLTRESGEALADDYREDLEARAAVATTEHDAFISLHANLARAQAAQGIGTFIHADAARAAEEQSRYQASRRLGEVLQVHLVETTGARDRGVRNSSLAVLRFAQCPPRSSNSATSPTPTSRGCSPARSTKSCSRRASPTAFSPISPGWPVLPQLPRPTEENPWKPATSTRWFSTTDPQTNSCQMPRSSSPTQTRVTPQALPRSEPSRPASAPTTSRRRPLTRTLTSPSPPFPRVTTASTSSKRPHFRIASTHPVDGPAACRQHGRPPDLATGDKVERIRGGHSGVRALRYAQQQSAARISGRKVLDRRWVDWQGWRVPVLHNVAKDPREWRAGRPVQPTTLSLANTIAT